MTTVIRHYLMRALVVFVLLVVALNYLSTYAFADDISTDVAGQPRAAALISNAVLIYTAVLSLLIPAVVDLVAKRVANDRVKQLLAALLSLIAGVVTQALAAANDPSVLFDLGSAVTQVVFQFIGVAATVFGFKGTLFGKDGVIAKSAPGGYGAVDPVKKAHVVADDQKRAA